VGPFFSYGPTTPNAPAEDDPKGNMIHPIHAAHWPFLRGLQKRLCAEWGQGGNRRHPVCLIDRGEGYNFDLEKLLQCGIKSEAFNQR
jgi:hypothetical protein